MLNKEEIHNSKPTPLEIDVLARTLFGEARGEYGRLDGGLSSLISVGNVILNRLKRPERFGRSVQQVCQQPYQFSCWNKQDGNYSIITNVQRDKQPIFQICWDIAEKLIDGQWPDLTQGSDHYHATWLVDYPSWTKNVKPRLRLGQHLFYQLCAGQGLAS